MLLIYHNILITFFNVYDLPFWENEGQRWTKKYFFLLHELLHQQNCLFYNFFPLRSTKPKPERKRALVFLLFKYFWNNLLLILFVQNVVLNFV